MHGTKLKQEYLKSFGQKGLASIMMVAAHIHKYGREETARQVGAMV